MTAPDWGTAALVVAHPGHELRVHHWLETVRPTVFVLTDGSGHGDTGRLASTTRVLEGTGATAGSIFGRLTDRAAYAWILERRVDAVQALALELADQLEGLAVDTVVSDAIEGFNPVHDLCFVIAEGAARIAAQRSGRPIRHFDFPLEAAPTAPMGEGEPIHIPLDETALARKMAAARNYGELRDEVDRATEAHGHDAFRAEVLWPAGALGDLAHRVGDPPFYETHGERRVAEGVYAQVLRFQEHFLPIAEAIRQPVTEAAKGGSSRA